jgi:hypothetical protein
LILWLAVVPAAQAQSAITGRVVEFGTRTGIRAAEVVIADVGRVISNADGNFRLPRVPHGVRVLVVTALGYDARELTIDVQGDTTLLIELEPQPIRLDSLTVRSQITVRGKVIDRVSRKPIEAAEVLFTGNRQTSTNAAGNFRLRRVPTGAQIGVMVRALEYLPAEVSFPPERDTTLTFELAVDPLGRQLLAEQVKRLEIRSRSVAQYRRDQWDRAELQRYRGTVTDLMKTRFGRAGVSCLFIDDLPVAVPAGRISTGAANQIVETYFADELQRVEIFNKGTMVRLYTRRYLARMGGKELRPITLIITPLGPVCQ